MPCTTPTTLDSEIDVMLDDLADVPATLHTLRARGPAVWARAFGEPALLLVSHELVNAAFRDEDTFPAAEYYGRVITDVLGRNLQCMRGEEHRVNRALVSPAFRSRLMPDLISPLLEPVAHDLIDRFAPDGRADLVADFTARYPFTIITRLLGLPQPAEDDVRRWALGMLDIRNHELASRCSAEFVAFVDPILQRRRTDPGDDLVSTLATTEVDGERLTDEEIFNFLRLLFPAGADTTYLGLGSTLYSLLTNPDQLAIVLGDLDVECRWAGEEGIRCNPPTAWIPRYSPRDIVWHGVQIPAGTTMFLGVMAANRDPAKFAETDRLDVSRRAGSVMTFGFGTHCCLGAPLARAEIETALRVILTRLPDLRLTEPDTVRITGTFHHLLRGPNRLPVQFGRP
ncbi:MAG TPA: cytochrome P450 [Acidimicrobiia bacterium]|nr:cytochrome P450 [Acidimicrobiia bacterium]